MIRFENVTKIFRMRGSSRVVARNISITFPSGRAIGLLGRNGAGKTTMLKMIAGTLMPDSGHIETSGTVSWPVGFSGSFHRDLTGAQNTRFLARVYGVDTQELSDFVEDFSELGKQFHQPVHTYSSGMKSRLAFGLSMGIHFDTYLIDETTAVGDASFRDKSEAVFRARMEHSGAFFISHSLGAIKRVCSAAAVLENGVLTYFDDVQEALDFHSFNMRRRSDAADLQQPEDEA